MLLSSTSLPVMGEIASINMSSLGGCLHNLKTRARWVPWWTQQPYVQSGEGWAPLGCTLPLSHREKETSNHTISDWLPPGLTRTTPSAIHQDRGIKHAIGASSKIHGRDNITMQACYWCIIKDSWKRQHHHWHMEHKDTKSCGETSSTNTQKWTGTDGASLGCEMRRKNFGETVTEEGHKVFVLDFVHKDIMNTVMGCHPVFSRLITIHLRAVPFSITVVQVNECPNVKLWWQQNRRILWPATECHWSDTKECTFLLCKETGMQKWASMLIEAGKAFSDPSAMMTQIFRQPRPLEFATFNDLVLADTFGHHKASRIWTWHSPNGQHHDQTDYILVRKLF